MTKEQYLESRHPIGTLCHDDIAKNLWVYNGYKWEDTGVTWEQYSSMEVLKERMTKQQKIREGIRELIKPYIKDEPWKPETLFVLSYEICELLHSQGVVLKVDGELLPKASVTIVEGNQTVIIPIKILSDAGYVAVEPLIEEQKLDTGTGRGV